MEREQAKKILLFFKDIDGEIAYNRNAIRQYENTWYDVIGGGTLDGMPKGKNHVSNPVQAIALNIPEGISEEMRELEAAVERLAALQSAIVKELNKLPLQQKSILYDFYIRGLQWVQIAGRVHYSETNCKKIRNRGLENLARNFDRNSTIKNFNYPN